MNTQELIEQHKNTLLQLEKERGVRVLFASVCGSRSYGTHSPDSDCDSHFVFVYPAERYLNLRQPQDYISCADDLNGWELRKFLGMIQKSGFQNLELLLSPMPIMGDPKELLHLAIDTKSSKKVILSFCGCIRREETKMRTLMSKKDYAGMAKSIICITRMLLSAELMKKNYDLKGYYPPIVFSELVELALVEGIIDIEMFDKIQHFLLLKQNRAGASLEESKEMFVALVERANKLFDFAVEQTDTLDSSMYYENFNEYFRKQVLG